MWLVPKKANVLVDIIMKNIDNSQMPKGMMNKVWNLFWVMDQKMS